MADIEIAKQAGFNSEIELLPSAARTATPTAQVFVNLHARGLQITIDVTDTSATPTLTVTISGIDITSAKKYVLLASAGLTSAATTILTVFPGALASANLIANNFVPKNFEIKFVHTDADSITYSVGLQSMR